MELQDFKNRIKQEIEQNPELKEEILDFYELAISEIEEGASTTNEINLCLQSIADLKEN